MIIILKPEVFQRAESVTSDSSDFSDICYILDQLPTRKEDLTPEQVCTILLDWLSIQDIDQISLYCD